VSQILLDQNLTEYLRDVLPVHDVRHAFDMGWDRLANGELLGAAERAGFDVLVTADKSIRYQQNLSGRRIALCVLNTNHWSTLAAHADRTAVALDGLVAGGYIELSLPRPPLRRRSAPERAT
jgi:hypothetical protein